ncbi:unnamed protein product, partial [Tilletia laevis]
KRKKKQPGTTIRRTSLDSSALAPWLALEMAPMTENQTQSFLGSLSKALGWPTVTSVMFRRGFATFWATVLQAHQLRNLMGHSRYSNLASTTYQSDFQAIDLANARDGSAATPTAQASTWRATASAAGTSKSAMAAAERNLIDSSPALKEAVQAAIAGQPGADTTERVLKEYALAIGRQSAAGGQKNWTSSELNDEERITVTLLGSI